MTRDNELQQPVLPTLQEVRRKTPLTSRELAEKAGVSLRIEYLMEIGGLVKQRDAECILEALSGLTGQTYTLATVRANLTEYASSLSQNTPRLVNTRRVHSAMRKVHLS